MSSQNYGIVVHGGAFVMSGLSSEQEKIIESKVSKTINFCISNSRGWRFKLDAVEFAVSEFEDSPLFNAGKGSVYTSEEIQEMDASIMFGKDRSAGAC